MCDTPIGTTRWITGQDRIVQRSLYVHGGRAGIVTPFYLKAQSWWPWVKHIKKNSENYLCQFKKHEIIYTKKIKFAIR